MTSFIPPEYGPVLIKIYDLTVLKNERVTFVKLSRSLEGKLTQKQVCEMTDELLTKKIIKDIWGKPAEKWIRWFEISEEYIPDVKMLNCQEGNL